MDTLARMVDAGCTVTFSKGSFGYTVVVEEPSQPRYVVTRRSLDELFAALEAAS